MKTYLDCIPCFVRQSLDAARLVTDDETIHERVLLEVLRDASEMDLRQSPPAMGRRIHRLIRELTGNPDPYRSVKELSNQRALAMYPKLKERIDQSPDPLDTAVRLAIAGNIIDFGFSWEIDDSLVRTTVEHSLHAPLDPAAVEAFREAAHEAQDILYLTDNAGEVVFDRLLVERLPLAKITFGVKGAPIINDATMDDARAAGLAELAPVISNGCDAPGTILEACSESFQERFHGAGLVIAKGQANYETLSHVHKNMFFLLKVKCPVIARDIGCDVGSLALLRQDG